MEELKTVVSEVLEARLKKKEAKADVQAADKEINTSNARMNAALVRHPLLCSCVSELETRRHYP